MDRERPDQSKVDQTQRAFCSCDWNHFLAAAIAAISDWRVALLLLIFNLVLLSFSLFAFM